VPHIPDFLCSFLHLMRLSLKKGAHAVLSRAAYRKFGASRSFFARCGILQVSPFKPVPVSTTPYGAIKVRPSVRGGGACGFHPVVSAPGHNRPLLCHLDRSVPGFPTSRCWRRPRVRLSVKRAECRSSKSRVFTGNPGERSAEICGSAVPSWKCVFDRGVMGFCAHPR
jgi:hypothetical protein